MTQKQLLSKLNKGIELLEQQARLQEEIDEVFDSIGVVVCGRACAIGDCYSKAASKNLQLYKGIEKLAETLGYDLYHPRYNENYEPYENRLAFTFCDYEIFELMEGDK